MKIQHKSKKGQKKVILILLISLCVVLLTLAAFFYVRALQSPKKDPTTTSAPTAKPEIADPPTQEQIDAGNTTKQNSINNASGNSTSDALTVTATSFPKTTTITHVEVDIAQVLSSGTCSLTITNGSITKTYPTDIQNLSNYSVCKGFDITNSDIGNGRWQVKADVSGDGKTGSTQITVNV